MKRKAMNREDKILKKKLQKILGKKAIDNETIEMCKALEFYDKHHHFPWDKKK